MTHTGIECFLAISRHKTISAAAQSLYITQPSLSARLKVLEQEIGVPLFFRCKGSREMTLTRAGQEFYQLAVEYEELIRKMQRIGAPKTTTLRVSCFNSLGTYLLPAVYRQFLQRNPHISLQIQDMEMAAASQSILRGETDLAFTGGSVSDGQLRQVPVFSEPMVLICAADSVWQTSAVLTELPPQEEVFVQWSQEFTRWHQKVLGYAQPQICVSIMAQLRQFLEREGRWAIVPVSVAKGLASECRIRQLSCDLPLPHREISFLISAQRPVPALDAFLDCLQQVLMTYPEIKMIDDPTSTHYGF